MSPGRRDQSCRGNLAELSRKPTATHRFVCLFSLGQKGKRGHLRFQREVGMKTARGSELQGPEKEAGHVDVC